jgi:hypothetical protein
MLYTCMHISLEDGQETFKCVKGIYINTENFVGVIFFYN